MATRIYYYGESIDRSTTTTTDYSASKVSLSFTPTSGATYAIFWSAILDGNNISYQTKARLQKTTATAATLAEEIQDSRNATIATSNTSAGGVAIYTASAATSETFAIQYGSSNAAMTAGIQEARILVLELISGSDVWGSSTAESTTASATYVTKLTLSWTPANAGDYLTVLSAEVDSVETRACISIDGGAPVAENNILDYNHLGNRAMYAVAYRHIGISGAHTAAIQWASNNAVTHTIRNAYGVSLRLSEFDDRFWAESRAAVASMSATPVSMATVTGTPSVAGIYMALACGKIQTDDATYATSVQNKLAVGGTGQGNTFSSQATSTLYRNWFQVFKRNEAASSTTWATQQARSAGAGSATSADHVLAVLRLDVSPDASQEYDLTVTDISWSPASPNAGDLVTFSATISNLGNLPTPGDIIHGIGFYVDGSVTTTTWSDNNTTSLAGGASRTQVANSGPSGVATWTATTGSHNVMAWVDDVARFTGEASTTNNQLTEVITVGGEVPAPVQYWIANWRQNVFRDTVRPGGYSTSIFIVAARNETEATQIVTRHTGAFTIQSVTSTNLTSGANTLVASANFKAHYVEYFNATKNSGGSGYCDATMTDPVRFAPALFPEQLSNNATVSVVANSTQPIWIKWRIPTAQAVGTYSGTITITTNLGAWNVPISIEVNEVTLPDPKDSTFTNEWWTYPYNIQDIYGYTTLSTNWWNIVQQLADMCREMRVNSQITWVQFMYSRTNNWSAYDQFVQMFIDTGGLKFITTETMGANATTWAPTIKTHFIANGWWNTTGSPQYYMKLTDEPSTFSNPSEYVALSNDVKAAASGTRIGDPGVNNPSGFGTSVDIWQPHISYQGGYDSWASQYDTIKTRPNNEVWFYTACFPTDNAINVHIDNRVFEITLHGWFAYTRQLKGFLFWGLMFWNNYGTTADEYYQTVGTLGDSYLIWPDVANSKIKHSIRSEAVRELAEDFELLKKLEAKSGQSVAMTLANSVITNVRTFEKNISTLETKRRQLVRDASATAVPTAKSASTSANAVVKGHRNVATYFDVVVGTAVVPDPIITDKAKQTNFSVLLLLGPNEIDAWTNARIYYLADAEAALPAYSVAARADVANLSGAAGLNTLLLRIYDHLRHIFQWAREKRPDVGCAAPSLIQVAAVSGTQEFNIYDLLKFTHTGAGLTAQGCINDICDAHQIHLHMHQEYIPNPWTGSVPAAENISPWHYWTAAAEVRAWRAANGALPDNTRPLLSTETGQSYDSDGVVTTGRTDVFQLRRLKFGMLVLGPLYYGCCQVNFFSIARSAVTGYNTIDVNTGTYYGGASPERDADYIFTALDQQETSDDISFRTKSWTEYWKDWQVWLFDMQQDPIDGGPSVCPFVEWNRITMTATSATMAPGGRNLLARKKNLRRGTHVFTADVKLSSTGSAACLRVSGHDKLNGLALESSTVLSGVQDWTTLSVTFTPRQHGNRRIPDPAVAVLLIDHNGTGTCEVRNPTITIGAGPPIVETYFDFQAMDVGWTPASPTQGQAVTFNATIKNVGNEPSPSGTILGVSFTVDDVAVAWSDNITAGMAVNETRVQTANGGPSGQATWTAVGGQHTVAAIVDDVNRLPAEKYKTNNTVNKTFTVSIPSGPQAPPAAAAAGLNSLFFNDEFTNISIYNSASNPDGTWRCNDFWMGDGPGYVDLGGLRHFNINQGTTDTAALATMQPYLPLSQLDPSVMRITAHRTRNNSRTWIASPALKTLVESIGNSQSAGIGDTSNWTGAQLTTERVHPYGARDITRPAYIEFRARWSPAVTGYSAALWLFSASEDTKKALEIDILESNYHQPSLFHTNVHHSGTGPHFSIQHDHAWTDNNWHIVGLHWDATFLRTYWDNVLSASFGSTAAEYFDEALRIFITLGGSGVYAEAYNVDVPDSTSKLTCDIDWVRVWRPGAPGPGPGPQQSTTILMANRAHMANNGQSDGTNRNVVFRTAFRSSKRAAITQVRVVYANSYLDSAGEHVGLNTVFVTAAVEYGGATVPLTFSGAREVSLAPGAVIISDYVTITIPANTQFWTRQNVRTANATEKYAVGYTTLAAFGEGYSISTPLTQVDTTGVLTGNTHFAMYAPVAVLGAGDIESAPSVVIIGSSTAFGTGEDFAGIVSPGDRGFLSRLISNNMGQSVIACPNNSIAQWGITSSERIEIINAIKPTHVICAFGADDILSGVSASTVQAGLQTMWEQFAATGAQIIQVTIQPLSSSTDGWTTTGGQTTLASNAVRNTVNTFIRSLPSPVVDIIDYAAAVEVSSGSGLWRSDGGAWTYDGVHTNRHADVAAALVSDYNRIWLGTGGGSTILSTGYAAEDLWDDLIIQYCAQHGHPNPRIVKCQVKWESNQTFDVFYTSPDTPCGIFSGWTSAESRSYGLLQVTPACGESGDGRMLLADGHPNLTTDTGSALWPGSVYNPELNLDIGIAAITEGYDYFKSLYPTCSDTNLALMAAAGYVGNWEDVTGCGQWTAEGQISYVQNVERIYEEWWGAIGVGGYDLVVDEIIMSPTSPTAGQLVTFSATIRNAGTVETPSGIVHGIGFTVDGDGASKTWSAGISASVQPGATRTQVADGGAASTTWTATSGTHTVIAWVDDVDRMPNEIDENNNTLSRTFTIGGQVSGYDLVVDAILMSPTSPTAGQAVTFSATIHNIGTESTPNGPHTISFIVDGDGSTKTYSANNGEPLQAGATRTQAADGGQAGLTWPATSGSHTVVAWVDDQNLLPGEANNNNNTLSRTFTVP